MIHNNTYFYQALAIVAHDNITIAHIILQRISHYSAYHVIVHIAIVHITLHMLAYYIMPNILVN